ncbi:MAG: hypothetical protein ACU85V_16525, partial [Gammaproteobacteria bacterium]
EGAEQLARDADAFAQSGALEQKGMIAFSPWLSSADVELVRQYVLSRAHVVAGESRAAAGRGE